MSTSLKRQIKFQYFVQQVNICQILQPLQMLYNSKYLKSVLIIWKKSGEMKLVSLLMGKPVRKDWMKFCSRLFPSRYKLHVIETLLRICQNLQ